MIPGFSSTDAIILDKFARYGLDTHAVYTRPVPAKQDILNKVSTHWINLSRFQYLPKLLRWLVFAVNVISILRTIKPDVILAQGIQVHGLIAVLSGIRPILLMPWGSDWAIVAQKNRFLRLLSRYVVNRVDLLQIDCETGRNFILQLSGGKLRPEDIWVFPQGIELDIFKQNPEARTLVRDRLGWAEKTIIIMTRQLKPVYGLDVFLRAMKLVKQRKSNVRALIVGDGPLENELKDLSVSLGLGDMVKFTGSLDRRDLVDYLNAADIYVSTSYSDGTSLSLLEAMAVGLAAVVTDVPANKEWIKDGYNGFAAMRGNPQSISEAILKVVSNEGLRKRFGERSFAVAKQRADWDRNFEQFMKMFHFLTDRRKGVSRRPASEELPSVATTFEGEEKHYSAKAGQRR
jgi:glycosyltransferase involved in cell wall biosynthesis